MILTSVKPVAPDNEGRINNGFSRMVSIEEVAVNAILLPCGSTRATKGPVEVLFDPWIVTVALASNVPVM
jgi:hypothetical protein